MTQAYLGLRHDILPLKQDTLANLFQIETPKKRTSSFLGMGFTL